MHKFNKGKSTHSQRLEKWLGSDVVASLSDTFKNFYYPIRVNGVPGEVYIMPGGDFAGSIAVGMYANKFESYNNVCKNILLKAKKKVKQDKALNTLIDLINSSNKSILSTGAFASIGAFASVDAIIAAYTGGKGQQLVFAKTGIVANAIGNSNDLWTRNGVPSAGGAASAAPAGVVPTSSSTGALGYKNLGSANSGHYLNWTLTASVLNNSLLLYDRIFAVAKTMNSTETEAVTGVPTRYQSTTSTDDSYIGGNFCFPSNPTTLLAATAHNWTVCKYTNQDADTDKSFGTVAGVSACVVGGVDLTIGNWFLPLAAGDIGVKALTQMQCSAAVATGTIDFVIGHPIAINACPIANTSTLDDGVYTTLNLMHIEDNACLSFLELTKPSAAATNYSGILRTVSE